MSLIWSESFDGPLTSTKYSSFTSGLTVDTTAGRNGTKGLRRPGTFFYSAITSFVFSAADEDDGMIVGFAVKYRVNPTVTHSICILENSAGGVSVAAVRVNISLGIEVTYAGGTLTTAAPILSVGSWYYVELKIKMHDTLGTIELRTNGVTRASASNVDTKPTTVSTINRFTFAVNQPSDSINEVLYLDDIYLCNEQGSSFNDFLGDIRIEGLLPNGNGNSSQWVGSDADSTDNYLLVNDANDATYVESNVDNNKDTYTHANMASSSGTILGVNHWTRARVDVIPANIVSVARLSGTETDATGKALTSTLAWYQGLHATKPGGGAWSASDVDSAEFGYKADVT